MPNYDFKCTSCNKEFERFSPMQDLATVRCDKCGGTTQVLIASRPISVHIFKSFVSDGIHPDQETLIHSKRQYKEELKRAETPTRKPWCPGLM